jgi:tetratricopeptide (TPR) repeat protein
MRCNAGAGRSASDRRLPAGQLGPPKPPPHCRTGVSLPVVLVRNWVAGGVTCSFAPTMLLAMKNVRASFLASSPCALVVFAFSAFAPAEATEIDPVDVCRGELAREAREDGISDATIEALALSAMRSHPGLSCTDYASMTEQASLSLRQYLRRPPGSRQSAHDAANNGQLDEARAVYGQLGAPGQRIRTSDLQDAALLAMSASDFREAARLFELAVTSANLSTDERIYYREMQAHALYLSGDLASNAEDLETALAMYRELSILVPRGDERWPTIQARLANAVFAQADATTDPERRLSLLSNSVALYRAVSEERERFPQPKDWARTQYNLGLALVEVGARRGASGRADVEAALAAHRNALSVYSADDSPRLWAQTQMGIATAFMVLSAMESSQAARADDIRHAIETLDAAVAVRTRDQAPLDWGSIQNNLGKAYAELGRLTGDAVESRSLLQQAIAAERGALEIFSFERSPAEWAVAQSNLGDALLTLVQHDPSLIPEAIAAFQATQRVNTRESNPYEWARANVSIALAHLMAAQSGDASRLGLARSAAQEALAVFEAIDTPQAARDAQFTRSLVASLPPA